MWRFGVGRQEASLPTPSCVSSESHLEGHRGARRGTSDRAGKGAWGWGRPPGRQGQGGERTSHLSLSGRLGQGQRNLNLLPHSSCSVYNRKSPRLKSVSPLHWVPVGPPQPKPKRRVDYIVIESPGCVEFKCLVGYYSFLGRKCVRRGKGSCPVQWYYLPPP